MFAAENSHAPIVPTLEQMGALSSLLVHDLANHLCIISGNATYAELVLHDRERVAGAIRSIVQASEMAGSILGKCGEMRQLVTRSVAPGNVAESVAALRTLYGGQPGWSLDVEVGLDGTLAVGAKWVAFAVERIIAELRSDHGVIRLSRGELVSGETLRPALVVKLTLESSISFSMKSARESYSNLGLLAAFETIRNHGGRIEAGDSTPNQKEVLLRVPFLARDSG